MAFLETPRFPVDFNYGTMGGPVFKTDVVVFGNGKEYRNAVWSLPRFKYDIRYVCKTRATIINVYEFFIAQQGAAFGFRIKDLWDFTSASDGKSAHAQDDQLIGTGDGSETTFQLVKNYAKGSETTARNIIKPVSGTQLIEVNGILQTSGVDYTLDTTTGIVTFTSPPTSGHAIRAGFEFDVPVRFESDDMAGILQSLYTATGSDIVEVGSIPIIEIR